METSGIKKKVQDYVDNADEKLLKLMYAIAREYTETEEEEYFFSEENINQYEERRNRRLNGDSKTFTWEEVKTGIIAKKAD